MGHRETAGAAAGPCGPLPRPRRRRIRRGFARPWRLTRVRPGPHPRRPRAAHRGTVIPQARPGRSPAHFQRSWPYPRGGHCAPPMNPRPG